MSRRVGLNVGLAGIALLWTDSRSWLGFLAGLAVGAVAITAYDLTTRSAGYLVRLVRLVRFGAWFLGILVRANLQIAWEIVTPGLGQTPRILRYPVGHLTVVQTTVLANCITLTPGTLVVDASEDGRWLYVHCMYAEDRAKAINGLQKLDDRLRREVFSW